MLLSVFITKHFTKLKKTVIKILMLSKFIY